MECNENGKSSRKSGKFIELILTLCILSVLLIHIVQWTMINNFQFVLLHLQSFPYLLPKSYESIRVSEKVVPIPLKRVTCQVLRSVSSWSCGFIEQDTVEQSIHDAYIQTITKAQHYIYIENQFFISLEFGTQTVRNQVADHLYRRIIRAFK